MINRHNLKHGDKIVLNAHGQRSCGDKAKAGTVFTFSHTEDDFFYTIEGPYGLWYRDEFDPFEGVQSSPETMTVRALLLRLANGSVTLDTPVTLL